MKYKVCLIVDNPLRDLEGIILIAWHLAKQNTICYIVPMYCQAFDILAIKPDLVLVNYIRPNNISLLLRYKKDNIKIAVLDTEGSPGKDMDQFAKHVSKIKERNLVDLYCMWGSEQFEAFKKGKVFGKDVLKITGCPRYDYCQTPYKETLPEVSEENYFLINTAFPIPNPKFTKDIKHEENALLAIGHEKKFVKKFLNDITIAHKKTIQIISKLCKYFPNEIFILRPHPFESSEPYKKLLINKNFKIKQEGTSLEWLKSCKCLIHLNCQTAIEATMLNKESISLEWLNTKTLKTLAPPINLSHSPMKEDKLHEILEKISKKQKIKLQKNLDFKKYTILQKRLNFNDGNSSLNVCNSIIETICTKNSMKLDWQTKKISLEDCKQFSREIIGFKKYDILRLIIKGKASEVRREAKNINFRDVKDIINRLNRIDKKGQKVFANKDFDEKLINKRMFSQNSIEVSL